MAIKALFAAAALALGLGSAASAATFTIGGGNLVTFGTGAYKTCTRSDIPGTCYDPGPASSPARSLALDLTVFTNSTPAPGLFVTRDVLLEVKFLGSEASAINRALSIGGGTLTNNGPGASTIGSSYRFFQTAGLVDFQFTTSLGRQATNGGPIDPRVALGFAIRDGKVFGFFDDSGFNENLDYDDFVVQISAVPLPAGAVLLLTGLAGLGVARRLRKTA